jgi:hypothetical protein
MRTLTLFALSLAGIGFLADDAQAFGKRRGNGCGGGGGCSGYVSHGCGGGGHVSHGCVGYSHGCSGYTISGWSGGHGTAFSSGGFAPSGFASTVTTSPATVRGTDGQTYTLGSSGSYFVCTPGTAIGYAPAFSGVSYGSTLYRAYPGPYPGTYSTYPGTYTYPGMERGAVYHYTPTVYPAGYFGVYPGSGVVPAGGTPLTMPGITVGPGGITIVPNMIPPRR